MFFCLFVVVVVVFWGGIFETALEGSVDHVMYRDYIVNRRFCIYCSQATAALGQTLSNLATGVTALCGTPGRRRLIRGPLICLP